MRTLQRLTIAASLCLLAAQLIPPVQAKAPSQAKTPAQTKVTVAPQNPGQPQKPTQVQSLQPTRIYPLPGGLDNLPMFNSNSPEQVTESGILLSTLPGLSNADTPFLDYAFNGDFGVFAHHSFKDDAPGHRQLYLGLLATNLGNKPVHLTLKQGATYRSQPDALFNRDVPAFVRNPEAQSYVGPGDRVTTELIAGKAPLRDVTWEVPACVGQSGIPREGHGDEPAQAGTPECNSTVLMASLQINSDVEILPPSNGRSTLMQFHSDGPVYLSHVAWFAQKDKDGFVPPTLADYQSLLNARRFSGKHEEATLYDPSTPPVGSFKYGRVAGVSQGLTWKGKLWQGTRILERPAPGEKVGYPIAATYIKRFGTGQNQSAGMIRRYPDTAREAHGNYGVNYELEIPLHNTTGQFQTYSLALNQPTNPTATGKLPEMLYLYPPNPTPMFRGTVRLTWVDEFHQTQDLLTHLVLKNGQQSAPLELITVPPGVNYDLKLSLIYPADATPPQLLTIERVE